VRRAELLWISPSAAATDAARAEGYAVLREEALAELDIREFVMRPPAGVPLAQAAQRLRELDPTAEVDFNHIYTPGGDVSAVPDAAAQTSAAGERPKRVGLIDGGVESGHADLRGTGVVRWGCDGKEIPSEHGTAIASLLQSASLYAADVYCAQPAGGAAEDVARAMAWMARERVAVVNVSLVGPANRLLERAVLALVQRGHLVVAAVGNDGPAAAPLYPASYPGVVGVTGVLLNHRVLPEAAQGPQVMFAAPGADVVVATPGGGHASARGTSYAVPFVARLLAQRLEQPDRERAQAAVTQLAASAIDLGERGRDAVYGYGLVGLTH
jgi:subtilisin family serine protease